MSVPVLSVVPPSLNVTVPLGAVPAPEPGAVTVTVAVKLTDWPTTEGLADEASVVVVGAWLTVWVKGLVVAEEVKLVSPP